MGGGGGVGGQHALRAWRRMKGWLHGDREPISVRGILPGSVMYFMQTAIAAKRSLFLRCTDTPLWKPRELK